MDISELEALTYPNKKTSKRLIDMYRNNDLYTLPLRNKDLNIEINETAKELRALVKKSAGLEKQYYEMLYKQLSNIKRAYKVCSKYGISVIDAILTANTIYATHQWDNTGLINNYMVIFLELDFKDKCFLSEYGFFDLDNKVFTSKYYYVVDVVLASIFDRDTDLIGMDVFKLNAILEDKLKEIRANIKHPATPIGWVGYAPHNYVDDIEQEHKNKLLRMQELQELRMIRGGVQ